MKHHLLTGVKFSRISLVDKGASLDTKTGDGAHVLVFKRAAPADEEQPMTITLADITKALTAMSAEDKESLKKALGAAPAPEDLLKGASPEVRALVEKAQADAKAANDRATANETAIAELKKADRKVSLRKRVDVYASLSGDAEALASILGCVEDSMGADTAKKFEETLKAWNEQVKKGLGASIGSRGTSETATGGGIVERIEALIAGVVQKDAKTTREAAMAKVFEENPDLYAEYSEAVTRQGSKKDAE